MYAVDNMLFKGLGTKYIFGQLNRLEEMIFVWRKLLISRASKISSRIRILGRKRDSNESN